jgi:hypothetical protein
MVLSNAFALSMRSILALARFEASHKAVYLRQADWIASGTFRAFHFEVFV